LDQEIRDLEIIHQQVQRKKEKMTRLADLRRRSTKLLRKCVILLKMIMTEGPNTRSFVKRAHSMNKNGTMILIMVALFFMMLLLWQQNYMLSHGHNCNTPGVYIPLDNEYEFKHVISVNKIDAKI
jgi:ABC-type transporter Mla maintaining outer membrane lipid asymmetry permease subunit MlaE